MALNLLNTKASHPTVVSELHNLVSLMPFGIKVNGVFHALHDVRIIHGKATYRNGLYQIERHSLSQKIKDVTGLQAVRWLNHLYFRNGFGRLVLFKTYVGKKHALHFT